MKLSEMRLNKHLTQRKSANFLNVSQQNVSQWENGLRKPDYKLLKPMSELYNCTIEDLINAINETSMLGVEPERGSPGKPSSA